MKKTDLPLAGAYLLEIEPFQDERGFFAVSWSFEDFHRWDLDTGLVQCNVAYNNTAGTVRGLHFQKEPYAETKVVRCSKGAIFDVLVDLRPDSATYRRWFGTELTATNFKMLYIPKGFAHGYQTLVADTEVQYTVSAPYQPAHAGGFRFDDPAFNIAWPLACSSLSERDTKWPVFKQ